MNTQDDRIIDSDARSGCRQSSVEATGTESRSRLKALLRNRRGTLRTIWRLLLYLLIAGILALAIRGTARLLFGFPGGDMRIDSLRSIIGFYISDAVLILAAYIMITAMDRRPFSMYGLGFHTGWLSEFAAGLASGGLLLILVFILMYLSGSGTVSAAVVEPRVLAGAGKMFLLFLGAAALEELLMRGYPFQVFVEGTTPLIGVVAFSALFGLGHTSNEHWGLIGFLNTSLAGALLSVLYLKTRSLWLPIGLHTSWNWTQGSILGIPVSGIDIDESIVSFSPRGSTLLNGGEFGAEASILATAVLTAAIVWTIVSHRVRPSERLGRLWYETRPNGESIESRPGAQPGTDG